MKYIFLYILACLFTVNAVAQKVRPTVAVLGDSYSTFEKYIPDTNKTYYTTTDWSKTCLLYTSPSPRDYAASRMPSSA